ncbi:hypothetical protein [Methylovulum sp.]|uniref:hypothetical protein n=1 Tax=Methylovulum sp. TaxID=1916980 RepID=UPI002613D543|nr:hypothetical protein [Methylovulum sp.]MDD5126462.1 hypothetical protein [Methylovulum sp.]
MGNNNQLWDIYDNYRTARLNVKYYCSRLETLERWNFFLEIMVAIAAPSSVISGLWFLKTQSGIELWQFVSSIAAIAGFLKPFLKLGYKIKFYEQTLSGYRALEYDLYEIILRIRDEHSYSTSCKKMFEAAMKKKRILATNPPENTPNKKLVDKFYSEVLKEIPSESLYMPEEA